MQEIKVLTFLVAVLALSSSVVNSQATVSNAGEITTPDFATTNEISLAEKIQNAFKFMMLPSPTTVTTKKQSVTTTASLVREETTAYEFFTLFETTAESPSEDEDNKAQKASTTSLPSVSTPDAVTRQNSTPSTRNVTEESDYEYDFITIYASTAETLEENEQNVATTESSTISRDVFNTTAPKETYTASSNKPNESGFNFVLLSKPDTTKQAELAIATVPTATPTAKSTTGNLNDEDQTTDVAFITVYESTAESVVDETTASSTTTSTTIPTKTTRSTMTTTTRRRTASTTQSTTSKRQKTTPKKTDNGDSVYEFKNTGIQFIIKSSTAPPKTESTEEDNNKNSEKPEEPNITIENGNKNTAKTKKPEIWDDVYTTEDPNGTFVAVGGVFMGGVQNGESPTIIPAIADLPWNGAYFPYPAKFWAKYWYWILIVLLLVIFLFIIPGFFCQIYLSKWCKKRKLNKFFKKRSPVFHFERIGFGRKGTTSQKNEVDDNDAEKGHQISSFSSSGVSSQGAPQSIASSRESHTSTHLPEPSLPEADIDLHRSHGSKVSEHIVSASENATVIFIPDPMSNVGITALSESESQPNQPPSFEFPEPVTNVSHPPHALSDVPPSIRSQSDIGLDIGNEAIIKSNNMTNSPPALPLQPPHRPPKPEHLAPKVEPVTVAPENRPTRPRSNERKTKRKNDKSRRHSEDPPRRHREKRGTMDAPPQRKRNKKERTRDRVSKKSKNASKKLPENPKKKEVSSTQSLMQAAKSLEDILDAITKLTREYPVPDLPELKVPGKEKKPPPKREVKHDDPMHKRSKRDIKNPEQNDRHIPDPDMMRRKKRRTKHWASEQQKIERSREKKRRKEDKRSSRKREPSSRRRKKRQEPREARKEKSKRPREEAQDKKESKKRVPTLMKEEVTPEDRIKEERRRMRLERDLKKLQKYHNKATKREEEKTESAD